MCYVRVPMSTPIPSRERCPFPLLLVFNGVFSGIFQYHSHYHLRVILGQILGVFTGVLTGVFSCEISGEMFGEVFGEVAGILYIPPISFFCTPPIQFYFDLPFLIIRRIYLSVNFLQRELSL